MIFFLLQIINNYISLIAIIVNTRIRTYCHILYIISLSTHFYTSLSTINRYTTQPTHHVTSNLSARERNLGLFEEKQGRHCGWRAWLRKDHTDTTDNHKTLRELHGRSDATETCTSITSINHRIDSNTQAHAHTQQVASVSVANRVAKEMGTRTGSFVGYKIRFDNRTTKSTRIVFLTDGVLLRECLRGNLASKYRFVSMIFLYIFCFQSTTHTHTQTNRSYWMRLMNVRYIPIFLSDYSREKSKHHHHQTFEL